MLAGAAAANNGRVENVRPATLGRTTTRFIHALPAPLLAPPVALTYSPGNTPQTLTPGFRRLGERHPTTASQIIAFNQASPIAKFS